LSSPVSHRPLPHLPPFPYTTLFRSRTLAVLPRLNQRHSIRRPPTTVVVTQGVPHHQLLLSIEDQPGRGRQVDRVITGVQRRRRYRPVPGWTGGQPAAGRVRQPGPPPPGPSRRLAGAVPPGSTVARGSGSRHPAGTLPATARPVSEPPRPADRPAARRGVSAAQSAQPLPRQTHPSTHLTSADAAGPTTLAAKSSGVTGAASKNGGRSEERRG